MASTVSPLGFREVLQNTAVKRLWFAQVISIFGDFLAIFAIFSVVTFQLHGTPVQVAMVLISFLTPLAIFSPVAGVYVDKWNVKAVMVASDLLRGALVLVLIFVRDLNVIYGTLFAMSFVSSFFMPAQAIAVKTLAPEGGLLSVNALMTQAYYGGQIIAPSVSGALVDLAGANTCFALDVISFLASAALVASLTIRRHTSGASQNTASVLSSLRQGLSFIFTHPSISFIMISLACGMFAVRCFGSLLSLWVRDVLLSTARTFGVLNTLIGLGMITGAQMVRKAAAKLPPERLVTFALSGMGLAVAITAAFGELISTIVGMLLLGFCAAFITITSQTLTQQETPPEMLGRVSSSMMSMMAVSQVISMVVAGPVAERVGLRNLYYASAVLLAVVGVTGYMQLRKRHFRAAAA